MRWKKIMRAGSIILRCPDRTFAPATINHQGGDVNRK
jgi:hypothetical protein